MSRTVYITSVLENKAAIGGQDTCMHMYTRTSLFYLFILKISHETGGHTKV